MPTDSLFPPSRFSAERRRAALAGRSAELRELERAYSLMRDKGQARTVTVAGATGIGKTRLVRDFLVRARESTGGEGPRVYRGGAREGGPAYDVFARVLRARFGILEGMAAEAAKAQVRERLATVLEDRKVGDVAYFVGQLLELDFQDSPLIRAVEGDPQQMRSMRRAVIKSFLEADAAKGGEPLVLVFEDLQWAEDDSLNLLEYLVDGLRGPVLLVCVTRPEMLARRDGWRRQGGDRHTLVELAPLAEGDAAAVMRDLLAPCGAVPDVEELVESAVGLAGGNPALLEQMVRIYHDAGVLEVTDDFEDERWRVHAEKLDGVQVPLTVEDAVQARIAALVPQERELLERAAAMGGVFWLGGLVAIHRQGEAPPEVWEGGEADDLVVIRQVLTDLVERDYLLRLPDATFAGDEEYVFKHNLEREALVRLTPPAAARRYHEAIADWLAFREGADANEEYHEMLARHRERAGAVALAALSYVRGGEAARARYAHARAADLFSKGLQLLERCDYVDEDLRLRALHEQGGVLQALGRSDEAYRAFVEMLTRAWRLDIRSRGGAAHARIGRLFRDAGRLDEASRHLTAALALFGQARDDRGIAGGLDDIGRLHWLRGDYVLALEYMLRSLAMRRKMGDRRGVARSLNDLGLVQRDSGSFKAALEALEQALRLRREIGDPVGVCATLANLGAVAQDMRDDRRAHAFLKEAYEIARETGDRNRVAVLLAGLGETCARLGDATKGASLLKEAEDAADELGDRRGLADAMRALGKAHLARGDAAKARACIERAVALFAEAENKVELGLALRSLGEATSVAATGTDGALRDAAGHLKRSIAIFEEMENQVELARSSRAYADLLRRMPEHATDPATAAEAAQLAKRAEEILAKMRANAPSAPVIEASFAK